MDKTIYSTDKDGNIIKTDLHFGIHIPEREELPLNEDEAKILESILPHLDCKPEALKIETKTVDYTSLMYHGLDIVRVKNTPRAKWIRIRMSSKDKKENKENPIFVKQTKKLQDLWITDLIYIDELYDFINNMIKQLH